MCGGFVHSGCADARDYAGSSRMPGREPDSRGIPERWRIGRLWCGTEYRYPASSTVLAGIQSGDGAGFHDRCHHLHQCVEHRCGNADLLLLRCASRLYLHLLADLYHADGGFNICRPCLHRHDALDRPATTVSVRVRCSRFKRARCTPHTGKGDSQEYGSQIILGWPMLLVGLLGTMAFRRKGSRLRVLTALAVAMILCGIISRDDRMRWAWNL